MISKETARQMSRDAHNSLESAGQHWWYTTLWDNRRVDYPFQDPGLVSKHSYQTLKRTFLGLCMALISKTNSGNTRRDALLEMESQWNGFMQIYWWVFLCLCVCVCVSLFRGGFEQDVENGFDQQPETCHGETDAAIWMSKDSGVKKKKAVFYVERICFRTLGFFLGSSSTPPSRFKICQVDFATQTRLIRSRCHARLHLMHKGPDELPLMQLLRLPGEGCNRCPSRTITIALKYNCLNLQWHHRLQRWVFPFDSKDSFQTCLLMQTFFLKSRGRPTCRKGSLCIGVRRRSMTSWQRRYLMQRDVLTVNLRARISPEVAAIIQTVKQTNQSNNTADQILIASRRHI